MWKIPKIDQREWELPESAKNTPGTLTLPLAGGCRVERKPTSRFFAALVVLLHVTVRTCLPFKFRVFDEWPDQLQAL